MDRALGVLSDLNQARRLVSQTSSLVQRLNAALNAPNTVSVFADLRRHREGTTALRNRITRLRRSLIRREERELGSAPEQVRQLRAQRRRIESVLGGMPTDEDDFIVRNDTVLARYRRFERELQELEVELLGLEARITATTRFLDDTAEEQATEGAVAIRTEIDQHRDAVRAYREEVQGIRRAIEVGRLQVGVGDTRYQRDERLRSAYDQLVLRERSLLAEAGIRPNAEINRLFSRLDRAESLLDQHDGRVDAVLEERTGEMRAIVDEESEKLEGYRLALAQLEGETEEVVGAITYANFSNVRQRFYDLVLRADVGRIDVAWQRREEHRARVDILTRERNREMQILDDEFRDIMDEAPADDEGGAP